MDKRDIPLLGPDEPPQHDLQEWMLLRVEERILRRITTRFALVAGLLVLLAIAGVFLLRARLETALLASLSRSATESLERDGRQQFEKRQAELQEEVAKARAACRSSWPRPSGSSPPRKSGSSRWSGV